LSADLDFTRLYSKSKFLGKVSGRQAARSNRPTGQQSTRGKDDPKSKDSKKDDPKANQKKARQNAEPSGLAKVLIRPLLSIRRLRVNYRQDFTTVVPGFVPRAGILGQEDFAAPGWAFIAGLQPNIGRFETSSGDWLDEIGPNGSEWITDNAFQSQPILQSETETLDGKLSLEPFTNFKIEVDAKRTVGNNFSIFYKDVTKEKGDNAFERRTPREIGSYSISYFSLPTLFGDSEEELKRLFNTFEDYRGSISQQRGDTSTTHEIDGSPYTEGFGSKQRDVIIPAFIAAYTGKEPKNFNVEDMFSWLPRPNWQLTYTGLEKLGLFKDIFSSVRISHGYKSTLSINSFETDLNYSPPQIDTINLNDATENYYSRYVIPSVSIDEQFAPLIGVDTWIPYSRSSAFCRIR
jgi:cell surface protein SprA